MRTKKKTLKKFVSVLCVVFMTIPFIVNSVGAIDTMDAKTAFSVAYMNSLPEEGKADFDKFSGKFERGEVKDQSGNIFYNTLKNKKIYKKVKYPDGRNGFYTKDVKIRERAIYEKIKNKVEGLRQDIKDRTPKKGMTQRKIEEGIKRGKISKHWQMPEDMRLAKAIYRWVAKVIKYDYDSLKKDKNGQETFRKPQDPLFVFDQGIGVCVGKANLVSLMMRMAGIPSAVIASKNHAFNAVYLKDIANNRKGWTLIDATWGAPESDMEMRAGKKPEIKTIKDILEISFKKFVLTGFEQLNKDFIDRINNVNKLQDRSKLKDSREYTQAFQTLCENLFKQYKDELKNNINIMKNNKKNNTSYLEKANARQAEDRIKDIVDDMNKKIKSEISRLNLQYKDIAKFRSFKIVFLNYNVTEELSQTLSVDMKVDLPLKEAKKIEEKFNYWSDERKVFFPGFYDKTLSFKGANEDIINWDSHKIEEIVFGNWFDESEKNSVFNLKIDGVTYKILENKEGKCDGIELTGDYGRRLENVKISSDMANLGMPFKIRYGIKSLILQGNEELLGRLSHSGVESINADKSTRYVADKIALYKRKKVGSRGDVERILQNSGEFNGVNFVMSTNYKRTKVDSIRIYCYGNQGKDVKLPEYLTQFNLPIKIGFGIESLVLKNDDVVDFSQARSLKSVDVTDSNKYMAEDGILYEKNNEFEKWRKSKGVNEDLQLKNKRMEAISLYAEFNNKVDLEKGEKFIKLASKSMDMMDIFKQEYENKIIDKEKQEKKNDINADKIDIYKRKKDGSRGDVERILQNSGEFNGVNFVINTDNEGKKIDSIKIFCYRNQGKDVKLPEFLTQFNLPIKIGSGIESLVLKNDDVVDFSQAKNLKSVDVTNSNKYMAEDGVLYEKNNGRKGNKIIVANKISVIDRNIE